MEKMKFKEITYQKNEIKERIDHFLVKELNLSRNIVKKMIDQEIILLNNNKINKSGFILSNNDSIKIIEKKIQKDFEIKKVDKILDVIYENDQFIIINKPNGILTHPSKFEEENTLSGIVKNYWHKINNNNFKKDDARQGICHRLDKYTEGLLIVAKNLEVQKKIMNLIKENKIKREYKAILKGNLNFLNITVDCPIKRKGKNKIKMEVSKDFDAKKAITYFEVLKKNSEIMFVKCKLETGRTHQIRVHANYINAPVLNDSLYGDKILNDNYQQYLFADKISFINPFNNENIKIKINLPNEFNKYLESIENE